MAAESESGQNIVAVAIDKDKNSQWAVKWTVDHLLKKQNCQLLLIHVKTNNAQSKDAPIPNTSKASYDNELQSLFDPCRGLCARKGFEANEAILHDIDVSRALLNYIKGYTIGTIVVGACSRNAVLKYIKQPDVPSTLVKSAPEFCTVYVISKGKVQSVRSANGTVANSGTVHSRSSTSSNLSRAYYTCNSVASSVSSGSSNSSQNNYGSTTLSQNNCGSTTFASGTSIPIPESSISQDNYSMTSDDYFSFNSSSFGEFAEYSARLEGLLAEKPALLTRVTSFNDNPRNSYSRENRKSTDMDNSALNNEFAPASARFMQSPSTQHRFQQNSNSRVGSTNNPLIRRPTMFDGSNYISLSGAVSTESSTGMSSDYSRNQNFSGSTSSDSSYGPSFVTENELDAEIQKLKLELSKSIDLYQSISEQAATAKNKADGMLKREEAHTLDDIKLARQAESLVADLERLKTKVATDAGMMTERLTQLETEKRKVGEQVVKSQEIDYKRVPSGFSTTHRIYSLEEIEEATDYFSASLQIGEGGYGPVYRATLQHTPVAIKVLGPDASQGQQQFQKEIDVLGRIRHPNMVLLLGACPQYGCLVYEYMANGSLEDRLFCKNNTPPIPWRIRFKIAAEIATALLLLHQTKPEPMVHRDLKPANILLDSNYTSKIADVGLARLVPESGANGKTQYHMTAAAGTFCYIDPEYQQTGLLGTKSDVYSLGVILLQLLTAKPAMALAYNVEEAIETGEFASMLDPAIPDRPLEQALSMGRLAIKCCELRKKDRPDLASIILPELIQLRDFAMSS